MSKFAANYKLEEKEKLPVFDCDHCGDGIYENEVHYVIDHLRLHKDCIWNFEEVVVTLRGISGSEEGVDE